MSELQVDVSVGEGVGVPVAVERIEAVVLHVLRSRGVQSAEISVALLGDAEIAELNQDYLQHEGPTDAITFTLNDPGEPPLGDICIGLEQAVRQAGEFGATAEEEVLRLAVHGTLHVLGFDHPDGEDRVHCEMFVLQEALLSDFLEGSR
jgi:probable rRNA maturation factor